MKVSCYEFVYVFNICQGRGYVKGRGGRAKGKGARGSDQKSEGGR
jgi:hypothetical protein